ncbi:MAG: hypothetical protein NZ853_03530 [Leptospiraceae bacterium]|nr:hypothetical protein [Leptospiraceae bacterium]MDW7975245.1 hypothetical protein [Leptospiraceae bacterium]
MNYFFFLFLLLAISCTNYSSQKISINPVIILSTIEGSSETTKIKGIERTSNGHILRVAAQNVEYTFKGYKLFQAPTEKEVFLLPKENGIDCVNFIQRPNYGIIYIMEVSENPRGLANLCYFPINLTQGYFVSIRVVSFIGILENVSSPSNAVKVP